MRTPTVVLTIAALVLLAGCQRVISGESHATSTAAASPSLYVVSGSALRLRPVLAVAPVSAGTGTGGPVSRQSEDNAIQQAALQTLDCTSRSPDPLAGKDDPNLPLVTCDQIHANKYLLGPAILSGADILHVSAGSSSNGSGYVITLVFKSSGAKTWANWTSAHVGRQVAFVLNASVLSAPTIDQAILGGNTEISGNFTEQQAARLVHQISGG